MRTIDQLVLVTGLSGAGKSSALHYLEDLGFFWVDNLPLSMIPAFLAHFEETGQEVRRVAVGIHVRDESCLAPLELVRATLGTMVKRMESLFMEADLDIIVTRYRATRRRHPIAVDKTIREAVNREASLLGPIRAMADHVIDSSSLTVPQLKDRLDILFQDDPKSDLLVFVRSFGFKYGTTTDADIVLDGRFLANPYYDPELRLLTGQDESVQNYLEKDGEPVAFLNRLQELFNYLIPRYQQEKKRYLTVDIGCTGGCHRSVYLVEKLSVRLREQGYRVATRHRDMEREVSTAREHAARIK
ncbi:MAG: RNase adapter RapZ [Magnetococcales bacterium]|nr:RNase adapter RapZ [Magnetococcales bacterium]